jgi:hypothetical protein
MQAKDIFWNDIKALSKLFWRASPSESELKVFLDFNGIKSTIQVLSLDEPARIEGRPWNGGVIDEMRRVKLEAWTQHIRPALSDRAGWCWRCGVPEGRNHYFEMAKEAAGGSIPSTVPGVGAYSTGTNAEEAFYTWYSSDILPTNEVESARRNLDPKTFKQEYEGSFETSDGLVYYAYTPDYYPAGNIDTTVCYDPNLPIVIGMDFNVNPMSAILGHVKTAQSGINQGRQEFLIFKGYFLKNSNTKELCERIISEYKDTNKFILTPCQSSEARQTVADLGITDLRIIKNAFASAHKTLFINKRSKNPLIKDRVNATNSMLFHKRIRINLGDYALKELERDLNELSWEEGRSTIDVSDKMRGHISAALDYTVEKIWPVTLETQDDMSSYIF